MKKLLALVLALVMSMSLVTISNAAFKDADKIDYKEAVDVMNAVGVFIGDEKGNFNAKDNLTREQAAKIIAYLELGSKAADALVGGATFTDVASTRWSAGFVGYCAQAGVVAGNGDGKFDPAGQLTALQFGKMLLVELGYDAKAAGMVGADWAINTSKLMAKAKLMDGIDGSVNQVLTREKAAQMTLNALEAPTVEYDTKGSNITVNGAEINFGASEPSYVTNTIAKEQTISSEKLTNNGGYTIELGEKLYKNLKKISTTDDFGRPATKWTWKSESVGTYADAADLSYTKAVKASDIYKDLNLSDTVAKKNVTVWVNGEVKADAAIDIKKSNDDKIGDVAGVNSNGNGVLTEVFYDDVADTMVITQIVTYIGEVAKTVKATDKRDAYVVVIAKAGGNGLTRPVAKGTFEYETDETFADDAFVLYTYSVKADAVKSLAVAEKVEGYVTKTINSTKDEDKNNGMTISGTEYKMSLATAGEKLGNVSVKNDYTVYLDQYGYIIYVEQIQEIGNYALLLATASKGSFIGNKAQLLLTDGTVKFVDTEENYATGSKKIPNNTIVTFRENSDKTYTLRAVSNNGGTKTNDAAKVFSLTSDLAGIKFDGTSATVYETVYANSATQFVVADQKDYTSIYSDIDDWSAYTGIKNAPTVTNATTTAGSVTPGAVVKAYWYCKSGSMATVMFVIPNSLAKVIDGSKTALYLSNASVSDLIHDTDGDYFTYNAVVDGKIETVKVDADAKDNNGTTAAYLDGLFSDYTVSSKGYITGLTKYGPYNNTSDKTAVNGVAGIDKTSKEYTVKLELKAGGTYQYTITCADDMKVFYVDKKGNITESSYAAIYPDTNDLVYAVVDKYLVKTLVIFEKEDTAPAAGTFDPADPKTAGIVGTTVVVPIIDGTPVDNVANVLAKNGYTVTGMFGTAGSATYWATKGGTTYFFGESYPAYNTITVNGTVVEYMKLDATGAATSKLTEKEISDTYGSVGTGYIWSNDGKTWKYQGYSSTGNVSTTGKTVQIKTGYVKVNASAITSDPSGKIDGVAASANNFAKANASFNVELTYTTKPSTAESISINYGAGKNTASIQGDDSKTVFTFTVPTENAADVTVSVNKATTYTVTAPKVVNSSGTEIPGLKGLTVTAVADKTTAKSGEKVTVTVTISGKATSAVTLTLTGASWLAPSVPTGVAYTNDTELAVADGTNLGDGVTVKCEFTVTSSVTTTNIKLA